MHQEVIKKLPFKESILKKDSESEDEKRINFFKGPLRVSSTQQIIIAIPITKKDANDDPFVLAIMTRKIKELTKEMPSEYVIGGVKNKTVMKKGVWCITAKLLFSLHVIENEYFVPVKSREIKIPLSDVYFPTESQDTNRENYILCDLKSTSLEMGQVSNVYVVNTSSLDTIRACMFKVLKRASSTRDIVLLAKKFITGPKRTSYRRIRNGEKFQIRVV